MKLSDGEKLILSMLCDLQQALKVRGSVDVELVRTFISDGTQYKPSLATSGTFVIPAEVPLGSRSGPDPRNVVRC